MIRSTSFRGTASDVASIYAEPLRLLLRAADLRRAHRPGGAAAASPVHPRAQPPGATIRPRADDDPDACAWHSGVGGARRGPPRREGVELHAEVAPTASRRAGDARPRQHWPARP